jgi:hypothetical protein
VDKDELREVLRNAIPTSDAIVVEHIEWALDS